MDAAAAIASNGKQEVLPAPRSVSNGSDRISFLAWLGRTVEHVVCMASLFAGVESMTRGLCVAGVLEKLEEEREAQKRYWEEHSRDLTVEAMMLDSRAADLDKEERPEVITPCHRLVSVPVV